MNAKSNLKEPKMREREIIKNKTVMWSKIKTMREDEGYSKSKIARVLGIHRDTVAKYLSMSESEYVSWLESTGNRTRKLDVYVPFVRSLLERDATLSSAAIHDRLLENFPTLPKVSGKTVYNMVEYCRRTYGLPKREPSEPRQYERRDETGYGEYAQVDFGEKWMLTPGNTKHRVRFMSMVLCRSRQKFYYFQSVPFTADTAVLAHDAAFEYFGGQPRKIIYDQDPVFLSSENLGDLVLTKAFRSYVSQMDFVPVFCRPSDPESKGMVENTVRYVKENFLKGREYRGDASLNEACIGWLDRTGNGKVHSTTRLIPKVEWMKERECLIPVKPHQRIAAADDGDTRTVLKDNTIAYGGNFYSLPLGTYAGPGTTVKVSESDGTLYVSGISGELVAEHRVSQGKGVFVRGHGHRRDREQSMEKDIEKVCAAYPDIETRKFMEALRADKPRYVHANARVLMKGMDGVPEHIRRASVAYCLENRILNAAGVVDVAARLLKEEQRLSEPSIKVTVTAPSSLAEPSTDMVPAKSSISTYATILNA